MTFQKWCDRNLGCSDDESTARLAWNAALKEAIRLLKRWVYTRSAEVEIREKLVVKEKKQ